MNPFDLTGPTFLFLYWAVTVAMVIAARAWRIAAEAGAPPKVDTGDPYLLAMLRGGLDETLRVALFSLEDRGLLEVDGATAKTTELGRQDLVRRPIERALLQHFETAQSLDSAFSSWTVRQTGQALAVELSRAQLLPDYRQEAKRLLRFIAIVGPLGAFGVTKIVTAIGRGRYNVMYLLVSIVLSAVLVGVVSFPRRTERGEQLLESLRQLFMRLRENAVNLVPGGATNEAVILAAVYGLPALPSAQFPLGYTFQKAGKPAATSDSGSGSDSSDFSSSSSSSCGSSCGGGCGGGCGGCGS